MYRKENKMEKSNLEKFFEKTGKEFGLSPVRHNYPLLIDFKKISILEEIRALLIDVKGKMKSL